MNSSRPKTGSSPCTPALSLAPKTLVPVIMMPEKSMLESAFDTVLSTADNVGGVMQFMFQPAHSTVNLSCCRCVDTSLHHLITVDVPAIKKRSRER